MLSEAVALDGKLTNGIIVIINSNAEP